MNKINGLRKWYFSIGIEISVMSLFILGILSEPGFVEITKVVVFTFLGANVGEHLSKTLQGLTTKKE